MEFIHVTESFNHKNMMEFTFVHSIRFKLVYRRSYYLFITKEQKKKTNKSLKKYCNSFIDIKNETPDRFARFTHILTSHEY